MQSDQLARLALCSRVLFERTIIDQQQQIDDCARLEHGTRRHKRAVIKRWRQRWQRW